MSPVFVPAGDLDVPAGFSKTGDTLLILTQNKNKFYQLLKSHGILLFRNFNIENTEEYKQIILNDLNFEYWYPIKGSYLLLNLVRKLAGLIIGKNDYRSYSKDKTMKLGSAENSIQGPHTETGLLNTRPQYLSMFCEVTSEGAADTGIYDLNLAYEALTHIEKNKYNTAWNQYIFHTQPLNRMISFLTKLFFNKQGEIKKNTDTSLSLFLKKTPLVCLHPDKKILCLQPWAFYNNTAETVHKAAKAVFPDRKNILKPDAVALSGKSEWRLVDKNNCPLEWSEDEQFILFKEIFKTTIIHRWQNGDIIILDNIKYGHSRLEDNGCKNRKLHQIQLNPIDMEKFSFDCHNRCEPWRAEGAGE